MHGASAVRLDYTPGLLRLLGSTDAEQLEGRLRDRIELERLRKQEDNDLEELKAAEAWLAEHSEQAAPDDVDPDWLAEVAKRAQEKEREARAHFSPVIAALKGALESLADRFEADVQQLLRDGIEVLEGWLAFYRGFYTMLARQAAERDASPTVLCARPVEGEVDHEALIREIIERFPKILAALAE
jgi:hypothetical protein